MQLMNKGANFQTNFIEIERNWISLTGFLHFLHSSGSGQSALLWPSWRQLKHFSGSGQSSWRFGSRSNSTNKWRNNTLMWPSLRQRRQTSGSGQSDAMCPCVELSSVPTYWICNMSYLLAAVAALVIAPSSTTPSWTVPGKETVLEDYKETTAGHHTWRSDHPPHTCDSQNHPWFLKVFSESESTENILQKWWKRNLGQFTWYTAIRLEDERPEKA